VAEFKILLTLKEMAISKTEVSFELRRPGGWTFGTLKVSKGSLEWTPQDRNRRKYGTLKKTWREFDEWMQR